jgi:hypothetical protein
VQSFWRKELSQSQFSTPITPQTGSKFHAAAQDEVKELRRKASALREIVAVDPGKQIDQKKQDRGLAAHPCLQRLLGRLDERWRNVKILRFVSCITQCICWHVYY